MAGAWRNMFKLLAAGVVLFMHVHVSWLGCCGGLGGGGFHCCSDLHIVSLVPANSFS